MFRTRQKKITAVAISLAVLFVFVSQAVAVGTWTRGNFEIHVFQVGQADSQLIVGPTGRTLLIDVGERTWNSTQGAKAVAQKIHQVMGSNYNRLDYIVATHLHADHIGYFGRGGIWALIENHGFTVGTLIDRDAGVWSDANGKPDTACAIAGTRQRVGYSEMGPFHFVRHYAGFFG
jgi:hypothetical protein